MRFYCILILISSLTAGCSNNTKKEKSEAPSTSSMEVLDDVGRAITFAQLPKRVIPLAPNMTELIYAAGAGEHIIAVSVADNFPPEITSLPQYSSYPMDYEALVSLKPDVLIATNAINNPKDAAQFTSLNLPVLYYSFEKWSDIPRVIRSMGQLMNTASHANQSADSLESELEQITNKTATLEHPSVLFLIGSDQLYAFGKENYIHEAIAFAGGESITATLETVSPILSEEYVLTSKPDVIIGTFKSSEQLLENHPAFKDVPAILNNRVCIIEADHVLRPGPRLLSGIAAMAKCLHPDVFAHHDQIEERFLANSVVQ